MPFAIAATFNVFIGGIVYMLGVNRCRESCNGGSRDTLMEELSKKNVCKALSTPHFFNLFRKLKPIIQEYGCKFKNVETFIRKNQK